MKTFVTIITAFLLCTQAFATNIWVSVTGTNTGTSTAANPWSTAWLLTHKNRAAGDSVFFKRGDVFPFALPVSDVNGTSGSPIYYGDYGTGAKPVFNRLTTLTSWTLYSGNIYYATVDVPRLQVLMFDGIMQPMARYPKAGFLTISGHSGLSSVTATGVSGIPGNPAGGEVVIRKARYLEDRHGITSRSGNTLNISSPSDFGPSGNYGIDDGNGLFVQSYLGAVTQQGDWYYDAAAKRLYVHFGGGNSSSHSVAVSLVDDVVAVNTRNYFVFNNLDIRGGNLSSFNLQYAGHITVSNCSVTNGSVAFTGLEGSGGNVITDNYIANMWSNGVISENVGITITNNIIRDIHTVHGMGRSGDGIGSGVSVFNGSGHVITGNKVSNVGYCGIAEYSGTTGNNLTIKNNIIDTFSTVKDDAGGIYMYGNAPRTFANRQVRNNYIKNGIGNVDGVAGGLVPYACGVYMDNFATQVNIEGNLVADNSGAGIFLHSVGSDTVSNNIVFNSGFEAFLVLSYGSTRTPTQTVSNLYVHHNQFIAKTPQQILQRFEMYNAPSNLSSFGVFNNNIFYRPFGTVSYIRVDDRSTGGQVVTDYNLGTWLTAYSREQSSVNSTVPASTASDFRVDYNATSGTLPVTLPAVYKDPLNTSYAGLINLQPNTGRVLMYNVPLPTTGGNGALIIRMRKVDINRIP